MAKLNPPDEEDVRMLLIHCKIATFFAGAPAHFNPFYKALKISRAGRNTLQYLWIAILAFVLTFGASQELYQRASLKVGQHSTVFYVTDYMQIIIEYLVLLTCFYSAIKRSDQWMRLFGEFKAFRRVTFSIGFNYTYKGKPILYVLKVISAIILYFLLNGWKMYVHRKYTFNVATRLLMLVQMLSVILVNFTLRVIRTRYQIVSRILNDFTKTPVESEKASSKNIRILKVLCKKCYFMVDAFNDIFGGIIFLTTVNTSSALLNCLMWFFERSYQAEDVGVMYRVVSIMLYVGIYLTFTILIVLSCDAIVKESKRFTDSCYTLHVNHTNHYIKEEFKSLAIISEKIAPRFSAAGFYTINQMFLSTLFTALTSYAIVCIQFSTL